MARPLLMFGPFGSVIRLWSTNLLRLGRQAGLLECGGTCVDPDTSLAYRGASGDCLGGNAGARQPGVKVGSIWELTLQATLILRCKAQTPS